MADKSKLSSSTMKSAAKPGLIRPHLSSIPTDLAGIKDTAKIYDNVPEFNYILTLALASLRSWSVFEDLPKLSKNLIPLSS